MDPPTYRKWLHIITHIHSLTHVITFIRTHTHTHAHTYKSNTINTHIACRQIHLTIIITQACVRVHTSVWLFSHTSHEHSSSHVHTCTHALMWTLTGTQTRTHSLTRIVIHTYNQTLRVIHTRTHTYEKYTVWLTPAPEPRRHFETPTHTSTQHTHAHTHKKQTHTFLRGNLFVHAPCYMVTYKATPTHAGFDYTPSTHKKPSTLSFVAWTRRDPPRWTCWSSRSRLCKDAGVDEVKSCRSLFWKFA